MSSSLSDDDIREKLSALGDREIPERFDSAQHDWDSFDSGGASHRYKLHAPLSEPTLKAFESEWKVELPAAYRDFLANVGNGGAGPGYGLFSLGKEDDRPLDEDSLEALATPFDDDAALEWEGEGEGDGAAEHMRGALPIATEGCQDFFWLIVSGPCAGQIWRTDDGSIDPVVDESDVLEFRAWYERWMRSCIERYL